MIITNISRSEMLRLAQTSFGTRILLCFNSPQEVRHELGNFVNFLRAEQIDFTVRQHQGEIDLEGSKLMFKVVSDESVKEKLAGILVSSIILNDVKLSTNSVLQLQHHCWR